MKRKKRGRTGAWPWASTALLIGLVILAWLWLRPSPPSNSSPGTRAASASNSTSAVPSSVRAPNPLVMTSSVVSTTQAPLVRTVIETNRTASTTAGPARQPKPSLSDSNEVSILTNVFPRPVQNVFEMQVALVRLGISPGSIDGHMGPQTRSALRAFQLREHLPETGELDAATRDRLVLDLAPTKSYVVTSNDFARLQPLSATWLGKSQQTALDYETILELVAERAKANPQLIRKLNPGVNWDQVTSGVAVEIPNATYPEIESHAAFVSISLGDKVLEAWDAQTNLLAHFPCSIARQVEKRPVGELHVATVAPHPNYTLDPNVFPESAEAKTLKSKLVLPPGPNNPVGVAWIGLDKPGYGIHGTPNPEQVGRTESHGCFRLANWNAEYLLRVVEIGLPVYVRP